MSERVKGTTVPLADRVDTVMWPQKERPAMTDPHVICCCGHERQEHNEGGCGVLVGKWSDGMCRCREFAAGEAGEYGLCVICGRTMPLTEMEHASTDGKTLICQDDYSCDAAESEGNKR